MTAPEYVPLGANVPPERYCCNCRVVRNYTGNWVIDSNDRGWCHSCASEALGQLGDGEIARGVTASTVTVAMSGTEAPSVVGVAVDGVVMRNVSGVQLSHYVQIAQGPSGRAMLDRSSVNPFRVTLTIDAQVLVIEHPPVEMPLLPIHEPLSPVGPNVQFLRLSGNTPLPIALSRFWRPQRARRVMAPDPPIAARPTLPAELIEWEA